MISLLFHQGSKLDITVTLIFNINFLICMATKFWDLSNSLVLPTSYYRNVNVVSHAEGPTIPQ